MYLAGKVHCVAFSPDSKKALTVSGNQTVTLWTLHLTDATQVPLTDDRLATTAALSADARFLVTGYSDQRARLHDAATGKPWGAVVQHPAAITAVALRPDGRVLLTAGADGS